MRELKEIHFPSGPSCSTVSERFEFRYESLKIISVLILFVYKLIIESLKLTEKIIRENAFKHKKKEPGVKFNLWLSANRSSSNWCSFLQRPGNFANPKSNIQIEI